jgi:hypothetical protein
MMRFLLRCVSPVMARSCRRSRRSPACRESGEQRTRIWNAGRWVGSTALDPTRTLRSGSLTRLERSLPAAFLYEAAYTRQFVRGHRPDRCRTASCDRSASLWIARRTGRSRFFSAGEGGEEATEGGATGLGREATGSRRGWRGNFCSPIAGKAALPSGIIRLVQDYVEEMQAASFLASGEDFAVWGNGKARHWALALEAGEFAAAGRLPEAQRVVIRCGNDVPAVWGKADDPDPVSVTLKTPRSAARKFPKSDRVVVGSRDDVSAVAGEGNTPSAFIVSLKVTALPALHIPKPHNLVHRA